MKGVRVTGPQLRRIVLGCAFAGVVTGFVVGVVFSESRSGEELVQAESAIVEEELVAQPSPAVEMLSDEQAFEEARMLGIVDLIRETRPSLREGLVERLATALVREAHRNGIDPLLVTAVAQVESHFNPFATSPVGARGVLQVRPMTGRWVLSDGETLVADNELYDIETNVELGTRYLASLVKRYESLDVALVAYNRGPKGAREALRSPEKKSVLAGYPRKVRSALDALGERAVVAVRASPEPTEKAL